MRSQTTRPASRRMRDHATSKNTSLTTAVSNSYDFGAIDGERRAIRGAAEALPWHGGRPGAPLSGFLVNLRAFRHAAPPRDSRGPAIGSRGGVGVYRPIETVH